MKIDKHKLEIQMVRKHMSVGQLQKESGVSKQSLARIKKCGSCQINTAAKLCEALECDIEELLRESEV